MSEVLSQSEIYALVASLQMNAPMAAKREQREQLTSRPKPYDFREKQKLPERYLQSTFEIPEEFCRRFETSLSNLRVGPVKFSVLLPAQVGKSSGFVEVCFSSDTVIAVMEQGHGEPCDQQTKSIEMQSDVARPDLHFTP